ncbi:MAG: glycerate kinase [Alphaproteobacteria bacterium]|nr:glycerate kinase [Alphaproteobacteria bacterium]
MDAPAILRRLFDAAVASCHPARVVPGALPARPCGRVIVVGAGKASAAMAAAVEAAWGPPLSGLVVTRYGHGAATQHIEVIEAGHPLPDSAGADAARRALALVSGLTADDFVLVLLSGGGSALWSAPPPPLTLSEKQALTRALVLSGASIQEINCVRKHLSAIKGGRLAAAAYPARVLALAISDVAGDDASVIASGPCVGDATTQSDARAILATYAIDVPAHAAQILNTPAFDSVKPGDARLKSTTCHVVARAADALAAAADAAQALGIDTKFIGVNVEGDARQVARAQAEIALHMKQGTRPLVLLSGGELTLQITGQGKGGPNREYLLALAQALEGADHITAFAADTDGIDGNDDTAGAWIVPGTLARARALGLDPRAFAANNDAGGFFRALGQEVVTGPTLTNVNDFRAILIGAEV